MKIITVSREFGSGGRELGVKLADALGIPFYDKELISMAADDITTARSSPPLPGGMHWTRAMWRMRWSRATFVASH